MEDKIKQFINGRIYLRILIFISMFPIFILLYLIKRKGNLIPKVTKFYIFNNKSYKYYFSICNRKINLRVGHILVWLIVWIWLINWIKSGNW